MGFKVGKMGLPGEGENRRWPEGRKGERGGEGYLRRTDYVSRVVRIGYAINLGGRRGGRGEGERECARDRRVAATGFNALLVYSNPLPPHPQPTSPLLQCMHALMLFLVLVAAL